MRSPKDPKFVKYIPDKIREDVVCFLCTNVYLIYTLLNKLLSLLEFALTTNFFKHLGICC